MSELTHFDQDGNARMVDVTEKINTVREAVATGSIQVSEEIMKMIEEGTGAKGDILGVARIAGIMATKRTGELIPLCHPLMLSKSSVDFELDKENMLVHVFCTAKLEGKTGVEMEALTGASVALLTIYDMCKAADKNMVITQIKLLKKSGGKSGDFVAG